MPKPRVQVESGIPSPSLRPVASPVDTFVKPTDAAKLEQLAQGLAQLSPALGRLSGVLTEQKAEKDKAAGVKKARELAESAKSFRDAIREGLISKDQSPWFMAGLREQFGRLAADRMQTDFMAAIGSDDKMRHSTKMEDFDAFFQNFQKTWLEANLDEGDRDAQFETGFGARADAYFTDGRRQFAAQIAHRVDTQSIEQHFAEVKNSIATEMARGTSVEQIATSIAEMANASVSLGYDGGQVNRTTVAAVVAAAWTIAQTGQNGSELRALDVLNLLDRIPGGVRGSTLGAASYGAEALKDARNQIPSFLNMRQEREQTALRRVREESTRAGLADVIRRLATSRDASTVDLTQDVLALADDPSAVAGLRSLQANISGLQNTTHEGLKEQLLARIWEPGDREPVNERTLVTYMGMGQLSSDDAAWLQAQMDQERRARQSGSLEKAMFDDPVFQQALSGMGDRFGSMIPDMGDRGDRKANARATLTSQWFTWRLGEGAAADTQKKLQFLSQTADALVNRYRTGLLPSPFPAMPAQIGQEAAWVTKPVPGMTALDLQRITREMGQRRFSDTTARQMQRLGLSVRDLPSFLAAQTPLLRDSTATPTP